MKKKIAQLLHRYPITVAYSAEDACYVARISGFPFAGAHGDSPAEAAAEAQTVLEMSLESLLERDQPLPEIDPVVAELRRLRPVLNIAALAKLAGMKPTTLKSRLLNNTAFTDEESGRIHHALAGVA